MNCRLEAAFPDNDAWLRVRGRAAYESAPVLRAFAAECRQRGTRRLHIDLAQCDSMDSTVIGVLTGIAMRRTGDGMDLSLANTPERVDRQIRGLGLGRFFVFAREPAPDVEWECVDVRRAHAHAGDVRLRETMLNAHETLGRADTRNVDRFKHVVDALRKNATPGSSARPSRS